VTLLNCGGNVNSNNPNNKDVTVGKDENKVMKIEYAKGIPNTTYAKHTLVSTDFWGSSNELLNSTWK
jgi:hypothetical protein